MKNKQQKTFLIGIAGFMIATVFSLGCKADIENPARKIEDIYQWSNIVSVKKVQNARVVVADYSLIKKDFPLLSDKTSDEIDHWILAHVAFISESQLAQTEVNTEILTQPILKKAFRPRAYNRALVFEVEGGMIDGKGFGAKTPGQGDHSNGLATLGEMIREYLYQKMVQKVFDFSGSKYKTVGSYAVIDWGFLVKHPDRSTSPAGAILRQAHERAPGISSLLDDETTLKIELLLRRYGITSAGAYRDKKTDQLNIQGTNENALIDFGAFLTVSKFTKPSTPFYESNILIGLNSAKLLQPDPSLRLPLNIWGTTLSGKEDPKSDNPWIWSHEMAEAFAHGHADRADVEKHLKNFLDPIDQIFKIKKSKMCTTLFL